MKQVQADKYNIAWFKLAECISRREKERALGVYRILSHSFDNEAIAQQLEGDILLAFNDYRAALEHYNRAAILYEQQAQLMQVIAVYDHMLMLEENPEIVKKVIELFAILNDHRRMFAYTKRFCHYLLKQRDMLQLMLVLQKSNLLVDQKAILCIELAFMAMQDSVMERHIKLQLIAQTVERLMYDQQRLQQFLVKLKAIDEQAYEHACACIEV